MIESLYLESCFVWHVRELKNTKNTEKQGNLRLYVNVRQIFAPRVVNKTSRCFYNADLVPSEVNHGQSQGFKDQNQSVQDLRPENSER